MAALFQLSIFAQSYWLPMIADWCGVIGLIVGMGSLVLTLLTFWKVQSVKEAIESYRRGHLLQIRLPEMLDELEELSEFISAIAYSEDKPPYTIPEVISALEKLAKICESIKQFNDKKQVADSKLLDLETEIKRISPIIRLPYMNSVTAKKELTSLYPLVKKLIEEIKGYLKNSKAEVDNGLRQTD